MQEGFPATALQIAHNFWVGKQNYREQVNDLFRKSYEALGRQKLIPLLEVAIASRQTFDKDNEEREKAVMERVEEFQEGMKIRFRQQKGEILKIEGNTPALTSTIQWEGENEPQDFRLDRYAFHFRIPSDYDFENE